MASIFFLWRHQSVYEYCKGYRPVTYRCLAVMHVIISDLVSSFHSFNLSSSLSDPLHAYLGLCGLSLIGEPNLRKVHPGLNITQRAFQHLQQLQQTWRDRTDTCGRQHWKPDEPRRSLSMASVISNVEQLPVKEDWTCWRGLATYQEAISCEDWRTLFFTKAVTLGRSL